LSPNKPFTGRGVKCDKFAKLVGDVANAIIFYFKCF
jgi:hypothetical protein